VQVFIPEKFLYPLRERFAQGKAYVVFEVEAIEFTINDV
jgi:hypothetical protein